MANPEVAESQSLAEMSPVIVFGGMLTIKQLLPFYDKILHSGPDAELPNKERFFPIPKGHIAEPSEMYKRFEERFIGAQEKIGRPVTVAGHSLGGLMATMVGVEHPDKVDDVVCIAGAQIGVRQESPTTKLLRHWVNRPEEARHIRHDSDFMQEHHHNISTRWSPDVRLHLISPTVDDLIPDQRGLKVELPEGQTADRLIAAPPILGVMRLLRAASRLPEDTRLLPSRPTGHVDIAIAGAMVNYAKSVRSGTPKPIDIPIVGSETLPLPAAA